MIITAHQPHFAPALEYLARIRRVDRFVLLTQVQFAEREYQNRNRLPNGKGGWSWLTLPVARGYPLPIAEVQVAQGFEVRKMTHRLMQDYHRQSGADQIASLCALLEREAVPGASFLGVTLAVLRFLADAYGVSLNHVVRDTATGEDVPDAQLRLLKFCKVLQADTFVFGRTSGSAYADPDIFRAAGVRLLKFGWSGPPDVPPLSAVHYLGMMGADCASVLGKCTLEPM